jgi:tetratricopeptide (TPR) repeat protein
VADTLERLATSLLAQGNLAMAELVFRECLGVRRAAYDDNHALAVYTESLLGECLTGLGRYDEAERLLLHAYPLLRDQPGADPEPTLAAARRLVKLYEAWGKPDEAARWRTHLNPVDTQPAPVP